MPVANTPIQNQHHSQSPTEGHLIKALCSCLKPLLSWACLKVFELNVSFINICANGAKDSNEICCSGENQANCE